MSNRLNDGLFYLAVLILLGGVVQTPAWAVHEKGTDGSFPWDLHYTGYHDKPVYDKLGKGFFLNVGPTGLRAPCAGPLLPIPRVR